MQAILARRLGSNPHLFAPVEACSLPLDTLGGNHSPRAYISLMQTYSPHDAQWLWEYLRDLFEVDDGSLPEFNVQFADSHAVIAGFALLRERARGIESPDANFWSKISNSQQPVKSVPNAAALVVTGEAEPFHVVLEGVESDGVRLPSIGVSIFPDLIGLDYRMGPGWNPTTVAALFNLLADLAKLDAEARLALEEAGVEAEIERRVKVAWDRWRNSPSA